MLLRSCSGRRKVATDSGPAVGRDAGGESAGDCAGRFVRNQSHWEGVNLFVYASYLAQQALNLTLRKICVSVSFPSLRESFVFRHECVVHPHNG